MSLFIMISLIFCQMIDGNYGIGGNIVQVSKNNEGMSGVQALKATLLSNKIDRKVKAAPRLVINAWMNSKDEHVTTFLLVDEVYDANERTSFPLKHPYLIEVSTSEQTLVYPLLLTDVVKVTCNENEMVQSREADKDGMSIIENTGKPDEVEMKLEKPLISEHVDSKNPLPHNEARFEPTDNEDDPNVLVERDSVKSRQIIHSIRKPAKLSHKHNRRILTRNIRSAEGSASVRIRIVNQTKENFHVENKKKFRNEANPARIRDGTRPIKNIKYKFNENVTH